MKQIVLLILVSLLVSCEEYIVKPEPKNLDYIGEYELYPLVKHIDMEQLRAWHLYFVNRDREEYYLPPYESDYVCDTVAQYHCVQMYQWNFYAHRDPWGRGATERASQVIYNLDNLYRDYFPENIMASVNFRTEKQMAWDIFKGFKGSPGHYKQIVSLRNTRIGLGVYPRSDRDGRAQKLYYATEVFY